MPLYRGARDLIRRNLEAIEADQRVLRITAGKLTKMQIGAVNAQQAADDLPLSIDELVFVGRHIYKSRILRDG
jgi:hypothetical protein